MTAYSNNKEALYAIIWGQCSDSMQSRLKASDDYEDISENRQCLELLSEIKGITYTFETQRYPHEALFDVLVSFYQNCQHKHQSNTEYHTKFKNMVAVINHCGGYLGRAPMLVREVLNRNNKTGKPIKLEPDSEEYEKATKIAQ